MSLPFPSLRFLFWTLWMGAVYAFGYRLLSHPKLRLTEIDWYSGSKPLTRRGDIQAALAVHAPLKSFFLQPLEPLAQQLLEIPWIKGVQLKKCWPNRLKICLQERGIFAHWNQQWYLDEQGICFSVPPDRVASIQRCHLSGPEDTQSKVIAMFKSVQAWVQPGSLYVTALQYFPLGAWRLELNGQWILHIAQDEELYLQINRFLWWLPQLKKEVERRGLNVRVQLDFRYPDGVAVSYLDVPQATTTK